MSDEQLVLEGREFTVSASEKVSTGEYENYEPHATIKGEIPAPQSELDTETRGQLRRELVSLHYDLQKTLEWAIENRLAADGHEVWPDDTLDADPEDDTE